MSKTIRELALATATISGDIFHVSGADLLDKRITIDDISVAVRETLKGPLVANGNVTIETGGLLLARANEDVIQELGRVKVWGASDVAYVSHYDFATAAGAGWQQNASGDAYLNGASGRTAGIRIANANILTATASLITSNKPITTKDTFRLEQITDVAGRGIKLLNTALGASFNFWVDSNGYGRLDAAENGNGEIIINSNGSGRTIFNSTTDNLVDLLQVGSDTDISVSMGRGKLGYITNTDIFNISHYDHHTVTESSLVIISDGRVHLNSHSGELVKLRHENVDVATFGSTAISLLEDTTITGTVYVEGSILQTVNTSSINIAPGTVTNLGGNITLFGGSHSVYPDRIQFRNGSAITMLVDDNVIIGASTDNTVDLLQVGADTDISVSMGKVKAFGLSDIAYISHYDTADINNFALKMYPSGFNRLNFATGQSLEIQENGVTGIATFSGSAISLLKPVTITETSNQPLTLITTNTTCRLHLADTNTTKTQTFVRQGNNLIIQGDGGDTSFGSGGLSTTGTISCTTIDTGQGAFEIGQNLLTTNAVTFATINTGYGNNEVVPEEVTHERTFMSGDYTLPALSIKQTGYKAVASGGTHNVKLPATGVYSYWYIKDGTEVRADDIAATNTTIINMTAGQEAMVSYRRLS